MRSDDDEVSVVRPALTVEQRCHKYNYNPPQPTGIREALSYKRRQWFECSRGRLWAWIQVRLPILIWLPNYSIKSALLGDVIAGITVAIVHISQGMAYALLANLPPITGLYMAFFPVLIYVFLGTSRHVSMGTFAISCLMMGKVVGELATEPNQNGSTSILSENGSNGTVTATTYSPQEVAAALALMVGIWEILLGLLNLGTILNMFLSDMLISGFTTGTAFQVLTSQVKYLFGIPVTAYNGPLKIIYTYMEVFQKLLTANPVTMLLSAFCILLLVINNEMKPRVKKYSNIPIPIELIVVSIGTLASYFGNLHQKFDIRIVGDIPTGLPSPSTPKVTLLSQLAVDGLIIGLVGYTTTFSVAKVFAKRHGYAVDPTQELYAQGVSNLFGSFFSCGPMAASLSRSLIQEAVGGVTLLTPFISCSVMLLILLFIGPLFQTLPNCVLSSIIVVSLKGLLLQFTDLKALWPLSRMDAFIWLSAFTTTVIIDVDYGLVIGVIVSMLVLLARSQTPPTATLGQIPNTDLYLDVLKYPQAVFVDDISIFQFSGSLHFANVAFFREQLLTKTGLESVLSLAGKKKQLKSSKEKKTNFKKESKIASISEGIDNNGMINDEKDEIIEKNNDVNEVENKKIIQDKVKPQERKEMKKNALPVFSTIIPMQAVEWVVVDLGGSSFVDMTGSKQLVQLYQELKGANVTLCIAAASDEVMESLDRCGCVKALGRDRFFHSTHDAVTVISRKPPPHRAPHATLPASSNDSTRL